MTSPAGLTAFLHKLFGASGPTKGATTVGPDMVVTPDATRCVQCGVCGYICPVGIAVRDYARQGHVVSDPRCVQCGQCVELCPRGTLRWAPDPRPERQRLAEIDAQWLREGIVIDRPNGQQPGQGRWTAT